MMVIQNGKRNRSVVFRSGLGTIDRNVPVMLEKYTLSSGETTSIFGVNDIYSIDKIILAIPTTGAEGTIDVRMSFVFFDKSGYNMYISDELILQFDNSHEGDYVYMLSGEDYATLYAILFNEELSIQDNLIVLNQIIVDYTHPELLNAHILIVGEKHMR